MKTAYVNFFPGDILVGHLKKIAGQAKAAEELGLDMDFVIVSDELKKDRSLTSHKKIVYAFPKGIMRKVERTFFKYKLISRAIDFDTYDIVVLRYPRVDDLACRGFYESLGHKIITEHHTNEVFELLHSWKLDPSFLFRFILENKNASSMLSRVAGLIGVTDEIRKLELGKSGPKPSAVISNGISTDDVEFTSFTPYDGKKMKMICIVSAFAPWHGLERLLSGLRLYNGAVHVEVCLLGNIGSVYMKEINKIDNPRVTIKMSGMKYGAELSKYFYESTIAVSSLALYKNRMNEACVLKSREYVARGIPFIYAYNDPDIPDDSKFALKLPNNGTPVNLNRVIDFAGTVAEEKSLSEEMRNFALNHLDWRVKIKKMHDFASSVYGMNNSGEFR